MSGGTTECALELQDVTKTFVGVRALDGATLSCRPGEVHALVGENGAGKSTLIKVAAGALAPDSGTVRIDGSVLDPPSVLGARRRGLLTAYQDTSLVGGLTVAENVRLSLRGMPRSGEAPDPAKLLEPYDLPFSPEDHVETLSPAARQLLEVVRATLHEPRVLLLDEPTATLDAVSIGVLDRLVARFRERGTAILYISHRLDEVKRLADRVTVIRDGRIQGTFERGDWEVDDLVELMTGTPVDLAFPPKRAADGEAGRALRVADYRGSGFGPVDLTVERGEIVGIAGAEGNGQRELIRAIVGLTPSRGSVEVGGEAASIRTPRDAIAHGLVLASGDREAESVFSKLAVMENTTLGSGADLGPVGLVVEARERSIFKSIAERLSIVYASPYQPVAELSGGNQQKTVLARTVLADPDVMVVDEPTAGVDARARLDIYRALRERAEAGKAILVNSSDAAELEGLCDRVYVLSRGRVVDELGGDDVAESRIVDAFVNATREGDADEQAGARDRRFAWASSGWLPLGLLAVMTLAVALYANASSPAFLTDTNLTSLLLLTAPLAAVTLGQQVALISGGFDISVGSAMSLTVVLASFVITSASFIASVPGILLCLGLGVVVGVLNGVIVRVLGVNPIITTIATLGVLQGIAILARPEPGGLIGFGFIDVVNAQIGVVPWSFIAIVALAGLAELWLRRHPWGLMLRSAGLDEESSRRTGLPVERIKIGAYVVCGLGAACAGLLLAAQVGLGESSVGRDYALPAFTACFLGGATLTGGRGSFLGALLGALFLSLLVNAAPLVGLPDASARTATGVLTIVAVLGYALAARRRGLSYG